MANDFSGDSDVKAVWPFDDDALDIQGGNDLTERNTPAYDASDKQEGTHSIDLAASSNEYCDITDANLDAGFPLKNGDTTKIISVGSWWKTDLDIDGTICGKYDTGGERSFSLRFEATSNQLYFLLGYNGGASAEVESMFSGLSTARWYYMGWTFTDSTRRWTCWLWDDSDSSIDTATAVTDNNINVEDADFCVGRQANGSNYFDGHIDETIVAIRAISDADFASIRAGTYSVAAGGWAHKFNGITSPGKVNGVANASIGKINGVAA